MSEFRYIRGVDPAVQRRAGPAIGLQLGDVLERGLPPLGITFELLARLADVLVEAEIEGNVHGDVGLHTVFVDETGAVALEGYGIVRPLRAPGGSRPAADVYGLGATARECLGRDPLPDALPPDPAEHDRAIAASLRGTDLGDLLEPTRSTATDLIAALLAADPATRPSAAAAAQRFRALAALCGGGDLDAWCAAAADGGGERRQGRVPRRRPRGKPGTSAAEFGPVISLLVAAVLGSATVAVLVGIGWFATHVPGVGRAPPARVTLTVDAPGTIDCFGLGLPFEGTINFVLEGQRLPTTCNVALGGGTAQFVVEGSGTVSCAHTEGGRVACDKARVP